MILIDKLIKEITDEKIILEDYKLIVNYGTENCGIYIKNDKIIKCVNNDIDKEKYKLILKLMNIFNNINITFLPDIYNIFILKQKYFIEMEKLGGDITKLLCELLPMRIIEEMIIIPNDLKNNYKNFFNSLLPPNGTNLNYEHYEKYIDFEIYNTFLNRYSFYYKLLLNKIKDQIFRIKLLLNEYGFSFKDNKFDNYGFLLKNNNNEHLGILFNNNDFFEKYLFIYIIDIESGLFTSSDNIIYTFNNFPEAFTIYGHYAYNCLNIINKFNYLYDYRFNIELLPNIESIEEINEDINYNNETRYHISFIKSYFNNIKYKLNNFDFIENNINSYKIIYKFNEHIINIFNFELNEDIIKLNRLIETINYEDNEINFIKNDNEIINYKKVLYDTNKFLDYFKKIIILSQNKFIINFYLIYNCIELIKNIISYYIIILYKQNIVYVLLYYDYSMNKEVKKEFSNLEDLINYINLID